MKDINKMESILTPYIPSPVIMAKQNIKVTET
jgi:hypothetical protein